ncbi:CHAD domain-containing protein [Brachybacterium sp. UNK5269]|uniref:CHAD domain-containing protein n=1 Tax=Brachybacterium sp. UNK5269 TaxID=3408576 RepID=UPI003BB0F351
MADEDPLSQYVAQHARRALDGLDATGGEPDAELVHATRTSLRRLRATLRTFEGSFPEPGTLDGDLRAVSLAFGDIRDADVLAAMLLPELDALPEELVLGPAREDLAEALRARRERAVAALPGAAAQERWQRAAAQLAEWCEHPPELAEQDLHTLLKRARRTVKRRLRAAGGDPAALHSARKAAKRWRYAAELLEPLEPSAAKHLAQATPVQELLGQVQDAVIAEQFLREHAARGARSGHNAFSTGLLHAAAQRRFDELSRVALDLF